MSNVVLSEEMKKEIDRIYQEDHRYNLSDLDGKNALRKALRYHAKNLDEFRCDFYLNAGHWNVRKALKLWQTDDIWEKQNKIMKKLNIDADEALMLLENCKWNVE